MTSTTGIPYLHIWDLEIRGKAYLARYRWRCCCGVHGAVWKKSARAARNGGLRHVAAMERKP